MKTFSLLTAPVEIAGRLLFGAWGSRTAGIRIGAALCLMLALAPVATAQQTVFDGSRAFGSAKAFLPMVLSA